MSILKCNGFSSDGRSQHVRKSAVVAVLIAVFAAISACSTMKGSSEGTWNTSYFANPDHVWGAIEIALIDLDYEIESKNRSDGVIRAMSAPADDGTIIALAIDQVMRTEDQVHVYVKPSFGGNEGSTNPDLLKAAADQFLKAVSDTLGS
jgi:hypothetical protein